MSGQGHGAALTAVGREGQTGCSLLQVGDRPGTQWHDVQMGTCGWAAVRGVPVPAGSRAARPWGLQEGNRGHSCKRPHVHAETDISKVTLVQLRFVLVSRNRFWEITCNINSFLTYVLSVTNQITVCSILLFPFLPTQLKQSYSFQSIVTSLFLLCA